MSKITLNDLVAVNNVSVLNENFNKIEDALNNKVLYRNNPVGEPNQMGNDLDMNGKRIYNLPAPVALHEPARLQDLLSIEDGSGIGFTSTVRGPISETLTELPDAATRANKVLSFDSSGNPVVTTPTDGDATALAIDLANYVDNTKGAALVGYSPSLTYPANSVGEAIKELEGQAASSLGLNLLDFIPSSEHAAIADWSSSYDATANIQSWINAISNNPSAIGYAPAGKYNHTTIYGFYDASLNPGFNVKRNCKLTLIGAGTTVEHYALGETGAKVGTLWNCTSSGAGTGWILSPVSLDGSPFLSRDLILKDMAFTGAQNEYLVNIRGVPSAYIENVEAIPASNNTGGIAITTSYFGELRRVRVRVTSAVTNPNKAALYTSVSGAAPGAGLFTLHNCNFFGLQHGLFNASGSWTNIQVYYSQLSASPNGYQIYNNGSIDKLLLVGMQFEAACRGWIKSETTNGIKALEAIGIWGLDQGTVTDAQAIYLAAPESVKITGFVQNMRKAIMNIDGFPSGGKGNYEADIICKFYEASGTMRTMFTGIIPDLRCDLGGAANARLYDPTFSRKPMEVFSKAVGDGGTHMSIGSVAIHNIVGQSPAVAGTTYYHSVLGYAASVPLFTSSGTVNLEFDLGSAAGLPDGYLVLVHNKGAGSVACQRGGATFATLAANTQRWVQWTSDLGQWL